MTSPHASDRRPILIAYAGGQAGRAAVAAAGRLFPGAEAVVLCVAEPVPVPAAPTLTTSSPAMALAPPGELTVVARRRAEEGRAAAEAAGLRAEAATADGAPGVVHAILDEARERDAEAIVVGGHGRSPLVSLLLGSTSGAIARMAERPVVVVPERSATG